MIDIYKLNLDGEPLENLPALGKDLRRASQYVNRLAGYAEARHTAAEFRRAGQIETAIKIEQFMESLYRELPEELRW
jgi:hypothetical protein